MKNIKGKEGLKYFGLTIKRIISMLTMHYFKNKINSLPIEI